MTKVLLDLGQGFGLGDACQLTILLKHLRKYRPGWQVDCQCRDDFVPILSPFCNLAQGLPGLPRQYYDQLVRLDWGENFELFPDRPSTKVAYALKHTFGIEEYDPALGRYEVPRTSDWIKSPMVCLNFAGVSHSADKNLSPKDAMAIEGFVKQMGGLYITGSHNKTVPDIIRTIYKSMAFVGIDSGPGKIASATDTPTLICWTGHHPLRYHDPAPNTMHLVPRNWEYSPPFSDDPTFTDLESEAFDFFELNYSYREYVPSELVQEACRWLKETLQ